MRLVRQLIVGYWYLRVRARAGESDGTVLVFGGAIDVVDDEELDLVFGGFEVEADGFEDVGHGGVGVEVR